MSELLGGLPRSHLQAHGEDREGRAGLGLRKSREMVQSQPITEKGLSQGHRGGWVAVAVTEDTEEGSANV